MRTRSNAPLVGIAFLGFIVMGLNAGVLGVVWPSIRAEFGVSLDAIGTLMLLSTVVSLAISFYSGSIIARVGLGLLFLVGCVISGLGFLGYAVAPTWWVMVLIGTVSSMGTTMINTGLNVYFATHASAGLMNWLHACFGLGATVSPALMTAVLNLEYSWRWGYTAIALAYGVLAVCFVLTFRRWPGAEQGSVEASPSPPVKVSTRDVLKLPPVWLSLALFFTFTGMEGSAGQWSYTLFTEARGIDPAVAGLWASIYWASMAVGRMFFGFIVDRVGTVLLIRLCMAGNVCGALFIWSDLSGPLGFLGLALIGFANSPLFPVLTSNTPQRLGPDYAAHAIGFQLTAVKLGLAAIPASVGVVAEAFGLETIALSLLAISIAMFLLHEATVLRTRRDAQFE